MIAICFVRGGSVVAICDNLPVLLFCNCIYYAFYVLNVDHSGTGFLKKKKPRKLGLHESESKNKTSRLVCWGVAGGGVKSQPHLIPLFFVCYFVHSCCCAFCVHLLKIVEDTTSKLGFCYWPNWVIFLPGL